MLLVIFLCSVAVACLTPFSLYLGWVSAVNRRDRPTTVDGGTDFAFLLLGLSGFILFGGGLLVASLQSNALLVFRGNWAQAREVIATDRMIWIITAGGYLLLVLAIAGFGVLSRSRALVVYNIDRVQIEGIIAHVLEAIGQPVNRAGNSWINTAELIRIQPYEALRNVTVWLQADDLRLREELERGLREQLAQSPAAMYNPGAAWLTSASVCVFCSLVSFVFIIGFLIFTGQ